MRTAEEKKLKDMEDLIWDFIYGEVKKGSAKNILVFGFGKTEQEADEIVEKWTVKFADQIKREYLAGHISEFKALMALTKMGLHVEQAAYLVSMWEDDDE